MITLRKHRSTTASICLGVAVVCFLSALAADPGERRTRLILATMGFLIGGLFFLVRALRTSPDLQYRTPMDALPPQERLRRLRMLGLVGFPVFLLLTVLTDWSLYRLYTERAATVWVWAPIGLMNDLFGPWPAAVLVPALAIVLAVSLRTQWRRAKAELAERGSRSN